MWHPAPNGLCVAVLAGGDSAERAISLQSGLEVVRALEEVGHAVAWYDPAETDLASISWSQFDVCFIALHGGAGEDGRLQRRLELLRVPYTGSGPAASRLAMSKSASKERFLQHRVPTKPYALLAVEQPTAQLGARLQTLGFPLVVKPDMQGSSLGVSLVPHAEDLPAALARCSDFDPFAVAEPRIVGREFTVAMLGRRPLPVLEIIAGGRLFDYETKYKSPTTTYRPADNLSTEQRERLQQIAVDAAACLGTRGLCRVDLMLDAQGTPWVLEVNTVPGLSPRSLAPKAAALAGLDLPHLCDWMVRDCLKAEVLP